MFKDLTIINFAPKQDSIKIMVCDFSILIERGANGIVFITVKDDYEGAESRIVLGSEGETLKL